MKRSIYILITSSVIAIQSIYGQVYRKEVNVLNSFFSSIPEEQLLIQHDTSISYDLFTKAFIEVNHSSQESLWAAKQKHARESLGLTFQVGMQIRPHVIPEENNFEIDNSGYARVGLQWDVIKDGFLHRKIDEQIIENERKVFDYSKVESALERQYWWRYQHAIYEYNKLLKNEYIYYTSVLKEQQKLALELYYKRLIPYSNILSVKHKIEVLEAQLYQVNSFNQNYPYQTTDTVSLSLFTIDIDKVIRDFKPNAFQDSILNLNYENKVLALQKKNALDLSLKLHYQASLLNDGRLRKTPVFGCTASLPLKKTNSEVLLAERQIQQEAVELEVANRLKEIRILHYEYTYKIKQYKDLYYKSQWIKEELLTSFLANQYIESNTDIESLHRLNELLNMKCEMIDVLRQIHLKALKILTLGQVTSDAIDQYTTPIVLDENTTVKCIVAWDASKSTEQSMLLMNYLKRKHIQHVYVSQSNHSNYSLVVDMLQSEGFYIVSDTDCSAATYYDIQNLKTYNDALAQRETNVLLSDIHTIIELEQKNIGYEEF